MNWFYRHQYWSWEWGNLVIALPVFIFTTGGSTVGTYLIASLAIIAVVFSTIPAKSQVSEMRTNINKSGTIETVEVEYIRCRQCGLENWSGYRKCQKCGSPLIGAKVK